jgi:hypothetical protein
MENIISTNFKPDNQVNSQRLKELLTDDLDFHNQCSSYASHNFHSFAAKFPPQLPAKFIAQFTVLGDTVLDPMFGSGTTILESYLTGRMGIGFDIDPLALMIARVKVTPLAYDLVFDVGRSLIKSAISNLNENRDQLENSLKNRWDFKTKEIIGLKVKLKLK